MLTSDMVISRLTIEKDRLLTLGDEFKQRGDVLDYDTFTDLEQAAETIGRLIKKMPWDKLDQDQLQQWYDSASI